jgi:hypothetical protein
LVVASKLWKLRIWKIRNQNEKIWKYMHKN